ncbi:MAG: hypothetical protein WAY88_00280 [Minisyncoccia bacterium]
MKAIILILILHAVCVIPTVVSAHGNWDKKPAKELAEFQKMLVKEGYLVMQNGMSYGVYTYETEVAFDAWDKDRIIKKNDVLLKEMREKREAENLVEKIKRDEIESKGILSRILKYVQSFFY